MERLSTVDARTGRRRGGGEITVVVGVGVAGCTRKEGGKFSKAAAIFKEFIDCE